MAESIQTINARSALGRVVVFAAVAIAIAVAWFGIRWQIGNMLGELTPSSDDNAMAVANAAIALAPRDAQPRWLLATKLKEEFTPESIEASVRAFEETVRRSPYHFQWWIELARAYEQADRVGEAERAYKRAVELAPFYTVPQWQIGNFYMRQDRVEDALPFLTRATEKSIVYREQVFALAWDYFDHDPTKVEQLAADKPDVRVSLAQFYAKRGSAADALRVWNGIPEDEKARHPQILKNIVEFLYSKRYFRQALEFARQAGMDPEAQFETVTNPGFEKPLSEAESSFFGWKVNRNEGGRLDILTDTAVKFEGQRSLKLSFKGFAKPELYNSTQLVAVQPNARYRLSFMLRVEALRTGGEPLLEVVDANNDVSLARSRRFPLGSQEWQAITVEFTVPENCDGITIRTTRESCGENCPISGVLWYDAFKLERL